MTTTLYLERSLGIRDARSTTRLLSFNALITAETSLTPFGGGLKSVGSPGCAELYSIQFTYSALLPPFAAQRDPAPSKVREGVDVTVGVNIIVGWVSAFCMLMDEEIVMNPIIVMRQVISAVAFVAVSPPMLALWVV